MWLETNALCGEHYGASRPVGYTSRYTIFRPRFFTTLATYAMMYLSLYPLPFAVIALTCLRVLSPLTSHVLLCILVTRRVAFCASHALS